MKKDIALWCHRYHKWVENMETREVARAKCDQKCWMGALCKYSEERKCPMSFCKGDRNYGRV